MCERGEKITAQKSKYGAKMNVSQAAEQLGPDWEYVTPGSYQLEKLLNRGSVAYAHVNQVWPSVYIGNE